ncbi:MAG: hypothetical protein U9P10_09495 [Thermodesulfobacteriota bacterium]|nr:hypothetical protein [Thermodesulfobacteriota bacterium]
MERIRLNLDLSRHCLETEIKSKYNKKISNCLKSENIGKSMEKEIEALKTALEIFDFSYFRTHYPCLAGGKTDKVCLADDECGMPLIEINGKQVPSALRKK